MRARSGFTLAETLFAMAILAFTVLTIVGMMPGALSNLQGAERREAEARIYQSLTTEYQSKSWRELQTFSRSTELYFDKTGLPLDNLTEAVGFAAIVERITEPMALPGTAPNPSLMRLRIAITHQPRNREALNTGRKSEGLRREYGVIIVDQGPAL